MKNSSHLNSPIVLKTLLPRQQKCRKVEEVTSLVSENESDEPEPDIKE
jgi:hypothetical protein